MLAIIAFAICASVCLGACINLIYRNDIKAEKARIAADRMRIATLGEDRAGYLKWIKGSE